MLGRTSQLRGVVLLLQVHHTARSWVPAAGDGCPSPGVRLAVCHTTRPISRIPLDGPHRGTLSNIAFPAQEHILALVKAALGEAKITPAQLDCIAYTKVSILLYINPCSVTYMQQSIIGPRSTSNAVYRRFKSNVSQHATDYL